MAPVPHGVSFPVLLPEVGLPRVSTLVLPTQGAQAGLLPEPCILTSCPSPRTQKMGQPLSRHSVTKDEGAEAASLTSTQRTEPCLTAAALALNSRRPCLELTPVRPSALHPNVHVICHHHSLSSQLKLQPLPGPTRDLRW